jgi:hypothetical protein
MNHEGSLSCILEPAPGFYPEAEESNQRRTILFP